MLRFFGSLNRKYAPFIDAKTLPAPTALLSDEPLVCVRFNEQYIPLILGALEPLLSNNLYVGDVAATEFVVQQIRLFQSAILNGNMDCDTMQPIFRQSPTDPCVLQESIDNGESWFDVFDFDRCRSHSSVIDIDYVVQSQTTIDADMVIYNGDIVNISNNWYYDGSSKDLDRDAALCQTAWLYVTYVCEVIADLLDDDAGDDWDTLLDRIVGHLDTLIDVFMETTIVSFLPVLAYAVYAIADSIRTAYVVFSDKEADVFRDPGAMLKVACKLYEGIEGEKPTFSRWQSALDNHGLTGNAGTIADTLQVTMESETAYVEFLKIAAPMVDMSAVGELPDCMCDVTYYEQCFDLIDVLPDWFEIVHGLWIPGTGVRYQDWTVGDVRYRGVSFRLHFAQPADISGVKWRMSRSIGSGLSPSDNVDWLQLRFPPVLKGIQAKDCEAGENVWPEFVFDGTMKEEGSGQSISSRKYYTSGGGSVILKEICFWGVGTPPFPELP